jgi:hypothetical protein
MSTKKMILIGIGIIFLLVGAVWSLQGINILPGSYMSGDPGWVRNGVITIALGLGFIWLGNRK